MARASSERAEAQALAERLRERRDEIEQTLLTRVYAISDPAEVRDPEYGLGLRTTVTAALNYALEALGTSEAHRPPLPAELPGQARAAARAGVSLDTVLRRYFAGYTLLTDCLVREAQKGDAELAETMRAQAELFDRLVAAVTEAYVAESKERCKSTERRRAERVKRLLRGELVDAAELRYSLEGWHLGVVASGPGVEDVVREIIERLECPFLLIRPGGGVVWAWLGARQAPDPEQLRLDRASHVGVAIALGEPGEGVRGWRSSHRQAAAALSVARRAGGGVVRYGEVALLAASLRDEVLADSLRELYLEPLAGGRDGGEALRGTLRAYLDAGGSTSSAAAALGVNRNTVAARLRAVEESLGKPLLRCVGSLDLALRLAELEESRPKRVH